MGRDGWTWRNEYKGASRTYALTAECTFGKSITESAHAVGDTVPLAICLAALRAVGAGAEVQKIMEDAQ